MDITRKINDIALQFFKGNNSRFAEKMGTSEANIRNYRSKTVPKIDFIVKLCNEFEISFEWMFNDEGPMLKTYVPDNLVNDLMQYPYGPANQIEAYKTTIESLQKVISAQEKTIETLEKLVEPKTENKGATKPTYSSSSGSK